MTPSIETILISQTILKWNLRKNGNLIREYAGIHGLPNNLQGFFVNFGDMLVKEGKPEIARKIYQTAMDHPDFETWPYKEYLIRRIENADRNVEKFIANNNPSAAVNDSTIMIITTFGFMGCHQK